MGEGSNYNSPVFKDWLAERAPLPKDRKALRLACRVDASTVSRWFTGESQPSDIHVLRIAQHFNVDPEKLREMIRPLREARLTPSERLDAMEENFRWLADSVGELLHAQGLELGEPPHALQFPEQSPLS